MRFDRRLAVAGMLAVAGACVYRVDFPDQSGEIPVPQWRDPAITGYRKALTVDSTQVAAPLADFPLLVSVGDPDLRQVSAGGKVLDPAGADIRFVEGSAVVRSPRMAADGVSERGESGVPAGRPGGTPPRLISVLFHVDLLSSLWGLARW